MEAVRLNAGGSGFQDLNGNLWMNDDDYVVNGLGRTNTRSSALAITNGGGNEYMYRSERWFPTWETGPYMYEIPVTHPGMYGMSTLKKEPFLHSNFLLSTLTI